MPCPECGELMHKNSKLCRDCNPTLTGENNPNWNGGMSRHSSGYIYLVVERDGVRKYIFEHILVMEDELGRRLFPDENVHHINGVRDDNRIENLELWVRPQPTGIRATDALAWAQEIIKRYG